MWQKWFNRNSHLPILFYFIDCFKNYSFVLGQCFTFLYQFINFMSVFKPLRVITPKFFKSF